MNNLETSEFCDVIGCRKPAAVVQIDPEIENEERLCEACFHNFKLLRPDLASRYRQILSAKSESSQLSGTKYG